ncbi:hypothetical protein NDS46_03585 [Paenibacillus thiaminolyticus]|uniref:hypothetical protein n=1 Tax=Paenibacillus thiaminolyticus TaxID=49283 RepID=UPI00232B3D24|nr:hypothetical protein [Paenibacillus thiaminolyticus]WCF09003.1 hypothetical protein NDS46_03585 [Paenibacillus thiaminolyticus]
MKKWIYMPLLGIAVVAVAATAGCSFGGRGQYSLTGKKVSEEYKVVINGKPMEGALIEGNLYVPLRPMLKELDVGFTVDGLNKVITVGEENPAPPNKFMKMSSSELQALRRTLKNETLPNFKKRRKNIGDKMTERLQAGDKEGFEAAKKLLVECKAAMARYTEELRLVEEALAAKSAK